MNYFYSLIYDQAFALGQRKNIWASIKYKKIN